MKKFWFTIVAILSTTLMFSGCGIFDDIEDEVYEDNEYNENRWSSDDLTSFDYSQWDDKAFGGRLGSAKELDGTTVIVSIFADDGYTTWDGDDENKYDTLVYLGVATDWLTESCAKYGTDARFIYDWEANSDLYFEGSFDYDMTNDSDNEYYAVMDYVEENIPSEEIMREYDAENIIYMFYYNTPESNNVTSATYSYYDESTEDYPYEVINIYTRCDGEVENPASYAHEILHTFGAPDFYLVDKDGQNYGITRDFVKYNEEHYSNDIMFTTFDAWDQFPYYERISNDFTDLDAYYVGLLSECDEVEEWGFKPSQH